MADIELVIKLDEEVYRYAKRYNVSSMLALREMDMCMNAIVNGIPLPKGHGRIVDIGHYEGKVIASRKYCGVNRLVEVAELDTIIEADKAESETI